LPGSPIPSSRRRARFESGEGIGGAAAGQLSLFAARTAREEGETEGLVARLAAVDPQTLTPIEALNLLARLVEEARAAQ